MQYPDRIPYKSRAFSQLSIARHYWWIKLNWESYVLDYDNCETKTDLEWNEKYFPDLVKKSLLTKKEKKKFAHTWPNAISLFKEMKNEIQKTT